VAQYKHKSLRKHHCVLVGAVKPLVANTIEKEDAIFV
jgi:hypothetical protein